MSTDNEDITPPSDNGNGGKGKTPGGKVGPGNPPPKHRFKRGESGNPNGRPRKKGTPPKAVLVPSSFQQKFVAFARTVIGESDGVAVDNFEVIMRLMKAKARDKPEIGIKLLEFFLKAEKEILSFNQILLREALAHKAEWGKRFATAAKLKKRLPPVYPHPDDIIIRSDNSVIFVGPITEEDNRMVEALIVQRGHDFEAVRIINSSCGDTITAVQGREIWAYLRRRYYRYSKYIPRRLKKPFPPFEPECCPEAWGAGKH